MEKPIALERASFLKLAALAVYRAFTKPLTDGHGNFIDDPSRKSRRGAVLDKVIAVVRRR
jgi:hypothetical protein